MPPRTRKVKPTSDPEFYEWDTMVEESHVDRPPFKMRVPVARPVEGEDTHEFVVIPCPSGASYINLAAAQSRGDVAGILVNLTTSGADEEENGDLFSTLMRLMSKAHFPIVDKLAEQVLRHYFNTPPKAADGVEGGPGESPAS